MNLRKKKELAAKALGEGKNRIYFSPESLSEIKEAITKQDILTLNQEGIIKIRSKKGRRKLIIRKRRKGPGKTKMKVRNRKQDYVKLTRKLRRYVKSLRDSNRINKEVYYELRKKIKTRLFKNLAHLKEYLAAAETAKKKIKNISENKRIAKIGGQRKNETGQKKKN